MKTLGSKLEKEILIKHSMENVITFTEGSRPSESSAGTKRWHQRNSALSCVNKSTLYRKR